MIEKYHKVALLFNANKVYDRGVMQGIGQFIQASQCSWDIFVEDDFVYHKNTIESLSIDGIIADFDDPETAALLKDIDVPIVAVGGSYQNPDFYPNVPYVATDISTQEIANVCGYPSLQYFYAVFKKEFGKTPREFRNE